MHFCGLHLDGDGVRKGGEAYVTHRNKTDVERVLYLTYEFLSGVVQWGCYLIPERRQDKGCAPHSLAFYTKA